jgi:hypothetical protein
VSSIAKGVGVTGVNTRGLFLVALIGILVVAILFIPELVDIQSGIRSLAGDKKEKKTETQVLVNSVDEEKQSAVTNDQAPTVVQKVKSEEEAGFFDRILNYFKSDAGTTPAELRSARDASRGENQRKGVVVDVSSTAKQPKAKALDEITWASIKSRESVRSLKKAAEDAQTLATTIKESRYPETVNSLYAYASGIKFVLTANEKEMSAERAFSFLEQLDNEVTTAMRRENVPGSLYNTWIRVTLGPVFSRSVSQIRKSSGQMPFKPNLRAIMVSVVQPGNSKANWVENGRAYLHFIGAVEGRDVARVEVYRDGFRLKDRVPRRPDNFGLRYFFIRGQNARGVYTFRVVSATGQTLTKSYLFYNNARSFRWLGKSRGQFLIPYGPYDPRLDNLFVYGDIERRGATASTFFTTSVGDGIGRF